VSICIEWYQKKKEKKGKTEKKWKSNNQLPKKKGSTDDRQKYFMVSLLAPLSSPSSRFHIDLPLLHLHFSFSFATFTFTFFRKPLCHKNGIHRNDGGAIIQW